MKKIIEIIGIFDIVVGMQVWNHLKRYLAKYL